MRRGCLLVLFALAASPACKATPDPGASPTTAAASATGSAPPIGPARQFDCGAPGQRKCPLQAWMTTVMARAGATGDATQLAQALDFVAKRAPPEMPAWAQIAQRGADRARAGDVDGAKESCKSCHATFKRAYVATLRDRPI